MALVALKQFSGAYHMLICHVGPPYGTPGAAKRARFGPERPFWGPWTALGAKIGPDCHWSVQLGGLYPYHVLGPHTALLGPPKGPILAQKGPFGGPGQPRGA